MRPFDGPEPNRDHEAQEAEFSELIGKALDVGLDDGDAERFRLLELQMERHNLMDDIEEGMDY